MSAKGRLEAMTSDNQIRQRQRRKPKLRPFGPALTFEERLAIIEEVARMAKLGYSDKAIAGEWAFYQGVDGKLKAWNVGAVS
jgi:hypothetical protein